MKVKINLKRTIISIVVIVGIFIAGRIIFDRSFPHLVLQGGNLDLGSAAHQTFGYNNMALLVRNDGLAVINRRGEMSGSINERFSFPFADINDNYILHAGRWSNTAAVYRRLREVYRIGTDENIMLGRVNRNGYSVIATEAMGFNGLVTVYNRRGAPVYRWFVGDGHIVDIDIAPNDNTIAIAKISADGAAISSVISFVDISQDEEVATIRREHSMISSISFNRDGTLVAISDTELLGFNRNGLIRYEVNFNGRNLLTFNKDSENCIVLAFEAGRGNTTLEFFNRDGRPRGSYQTQGRLRNITVSGDVILANRLRTVMKITPNGRSQELITVPHDIVSLQIMDDRRHALVVGGSQANVIRF